jgi:pseudouridine-5'-phosphate glycosidase
VNFHPEVKQALGEGRAVVALESTVITHGLPRPMNLELAQSLEQTVRSEGAVPATIGIIEGEIWVGLTSAQLESVAADSSADKASLWNLGAIVAQKRSAGTTVATTAFLGHKAGISVFATGGIGGVHPHPFDESADLIELSRTPMLVVCAGAKSILDLPATLERLESYGVGLIGYRTDTLPAFHTRQSPFRLPARVETPAQAAQVLKASRSLGLPGATLVLNPVSEGLDYTRVQSWVEQANRDAAEAGIKGKALTPFLLRKLSELSGGQTDTVNLRLLRENAALAGQIAAALD